MTHYKTDVAIIGGGLAGIVTALELIDQGQQVLILDRDIEARFGGLAKESFGGIFFANSPVQRRMGIRDSIELALSDWHSFAEFEPDATWPRKWAEHYVNLSTPKVYEWLKRSGIKFFPVVHWVERGLLKAGNSVPRFHMVWGTGQGLIETLVKNLNAHPNRKFMTLLFGHKVTQISHSNGKASGFTGVNEANGENFEVVTDTVVVASGGICGNIPKIKQNWYKPWGEPPEIILNGSHEFALGDIHDLVTGLNAKVTHQEKVWLYAAGVHHHRPQRPNHGLSLIPPRSALWLDSKGKRFGPMPLVSSYDTRFLVEQICSQEHKHSWQVLNYKIAVKEMAISGSEFNQAMRDKNILKFLSTVLFGNKKLVDELIDQNQDFVVANSIGELVEKMNALTGQNLVKAEFVQDAIVKNSQGHLECRAQVAHNLVQHTLHSDLE